MAISILGFIYYFFKKRIDSFLSKPAKIKRVKKIQEQVPDSILIKEEELPEVLHKHPEVQATPVSSGRKVSATNRLKRVEVFNPTSLTSGPANRDWGSQWN